MGNDAHSISGLVMGACLRCFTLLLQLHRTSASTVSSFFFSISEHDCCADFVQSEKAKAERSGQPD